MIKAEAGLMFLLMCFAFQISKEAWTLLEIYSTWWGETLGAVNCVVNGPVELNGVELLLSFFLGYCISASTWFLRRAIWEVYEQRSLQEDPT